MDAVRDAVFMIVVIPLSAYVASGAIVLAAFVIMAPILGVVRLHMALSPEYAQEVAERIKQRRSRKNRRPDVSKRPIDNTPRA